MEESSEAHMETDVSSTTDDVPEVPQAAVCQTNLQMEIVVEEMKVELESSVDADSRRSTPSTSTCTSPQKPATPHKVITPHSNSTEAAKILIPNNCQSSPSKPPIPSKMSPEKQQPESSDSLKKIESNSCVKSVEKVINKSPIKITPIKIAQSTPIKELKVAKGAIKLIRIREMPKSNEAVVQDNSPTKKVQNKTDKEVTLIKISNKEIKLPEMPVKSVESPEKANKEKTSLQNDVPPIDKPEKVVPEVTPSEVQQEETANTAVELNIRVTSKDPDNKSEETTQGTIDKVSSDNSVSGIDTTSKTSTPAGNTVNGGDKNDNPEPNESRRDLNDSLNMDVEKEHNKSISRELKSLIMSAKESKIISECTQLTSKTRKSRTQVDSSNTSLNSSLDADKVSARRRSNTSQVSNSSEKSEKGKRSMRSQNPDFASKCKMFMNSITSKVMKDSDDAMSDDEVMKSADKLKSNVSVSTSTSPSPKKKKMSDPPIITVKGSKMRSDNYCWRCHWSVVREENDKSHPPIYCTMCPRTFHFKCLTSNERKTSTEQNWVCPDCLTILQAETSDTRSPAMKKTSLGMLCDLLKYALQRMMDLNGVEPFMNPVDRAIFPDYDKYVVHPMDLSQMKRNIADGIYGSTEAFVADAQWILHNSIIFNTLQSKLTAGARALVRSCRAEMSEIEACPECYAAAHVRRATWFTDVCSSPHILLWAKLKGFPYWPAKAMTVNSSGLVDVRFFGAHDRAWVPAKDCFLYSEKDPNNFRSKRQDILDSMQEAEQHIRNISRKYGKFVYPPFKTQFDATKLTEQLKLMIPSFDGEARAPLKEKQPTASPVAKAKRRSISKRSKSLALDGEIDTSIYTESPKTNKKDSEEKNTTEKSPDTDSPASEKQAQQKQEFIVTRKRRRSNLEEARILTVIETSSPVPEKKNKVEKLEQQEPSSTKEDKAQSATKEVEPTKKKVEAQKSKSKDEEPSSSTQDAEPLRVTPIKLVALPRTNKQTPQLFAATKSPLNSSRTNKDDKTPQKPKVKPPTTEKSKDDKAKKRRSSKSNKSLNGSAVKTSKVENSQEPEMAEKEEKDSKQDKDAKKQDNDNKKQENDNKKQEKDAKKQENESKKQDKKRPENENVDKPEEPKVDSTKPIKDRIMFDDDTSLAVIARERRRSNANLPTISSVCSLSTGEASAAVSIEASSSIFTPTSTDSVRTVKDAATKLQKLRDNTEPIVGRVGVRAFARMTSPPRQKTPESMEVEIKAEPIDLDEDRMTEKMDLMTACKLQPVAQSLRDVRISRVVGAPDSKKVEVRSRARKTFPQPRPSEGRSELNAKNTMVYIPIQPATQPPRATRPSQSNRSNALTNGNNTINTAVTPLKPTTTISNSVVSVPTVAQVSMSSVGQAPMASTGQVSVPTVAPPSMPSVGQLSLPTVGQPSLPTVGQPSLPTVGQVPTTVHTLPMMTSVNGQWMFSLQPIMSVGGVDNSNSTPLVNGSVTPTIAPVPAPTAPGASPAPNRTNENTTIELPRLQQRPPWAHNLESPSSGAVSVPPSVAGPVTNKILQSAQKLTDVFKSLIEETLDELKDVSSSLDTVRTLEQERWRHAAEIEELKHNHELTLAEMRLSFEKDKVRVVNETRRAAQAELELAVKLAKSKQWCANCNQEAQYYCCWNTSYCDFPCQRAHWPAHYTQCAHRTKESTTNDNTSDVQILPEVPSLQKSSQLQAPALTVGGKVANRVFAPQDATAHKASIIVSMVEDNSGNQTMKCVGTYKPGGAPPLILNKQMVSEEAGKKVVTSGGYLIVGAGNNTSVITPAQQARRPNVQYFT